MTFLFFALAGVVAALIARRVLAVPSVRRVVLRHRQPRCVVRYVPPPPGTAGPEGSE